MEIRVLLVITIVRLVMDLEKINATNVQKDILIMETSARNAKMTVFSAQIPQLATAVKPQNTSILMDRVQEAVRVPVLQSSQASETLDIVWPNAQVDSI